LNEKKPDSIAGGLRFGEIWMGSYKIAVVRDTAIW